MPGPAEPRLRLAATGDRASLSAKSPPPLSGSRRTSRAPSPAARLPTMKTRRRRWALRSNDCPDPRRGRETRSRQRAEKDHEMSSTGGRGGRETQRRSSRRSTRSSAIRGTQRRVQIGHVKSCSSPSDREVLAGEPAADEIKTRWAAECAVAGGAVVASSQRSSSSGPPCGP